ncbi:MAG: hypothetical protein ACOYD0_03560 [Candidatus Nanopelagicales bacterium]
MSFLTCGRSNASWWHQSTVASEASALGLQPIMWTGQAFDWRAKKADQIVSDMETETRPGAVLLLHDGGGDRSPTIDALKKLLPYWQQQGWKLKTVPACD